MNSALEDVCVLQRELDAAGDDLAQALPAFEQQRQPDSEALAKLVQVCMCVLLVWCSGVLTMTLFRHVHACRIAMLFRHFKDIRVVYPAKQHACGVQL